MFFRRYKNEKGITIVELIVVLAIFSFLILAAVSIFISAIQSQERALGEQDFSNEIGYMMELISRKARMATTDNTGSCLGSGFINSSYLLTRYNSSSSFYQGIKFISDDKACYEFFLDTDGVIKEIKNGGAAQGILSSKFIVSYVRFLIDGQKNIQSAPESSLIQSRITFALDVTIPTKQGQQEKLVQTTVSQRNLKPFIK